MTQFPFLRPEELPPFLLEREDECSSLDLERDLEKEEMDLDLDEDILSLCRPLSGLWPEEDPDPLCRGVFRLELCGLEPSPSSSEAEEEEVMLLFSISVCCTISTLLAPTWKIMILVGSPMSVLLLQTQCCCLMWCVVSLPTPTSLPIPSNTNGYFSFTNSFLPNLTTEEIP